MVIRSIPSCDLRLVCDLYTPMFQLWNLHVRGNAACDFQSTHQSIQLGG